MRAQDANAPRISNSIANIPAEAITRLAAVMAFHDEALGAYAVRMALPALGSSDRNVVVIHVVGDPRSCMDDCARCLSNVLGSSANIHVVPLYAGDTLLSQVAATTAPFYRR